MRPVSIGTFLFSFFAVARLVSAASLAEEDIMPDSLRARPRASTFTLTGTRGLSRTAAAEALGENRLALGLSGPRYSSQRSFSRASGREAGGFTGVGALAYGVAAPASDVFLSLTGHGGHGGPSGGGSGGLGAMGLGA